MDGIVRGVTQLRTRLEKEQLECFVSRDVDFEKPRMMGMIRRAHVNLGHPSRERFI